MKCNSCGGVVGNIYGIVNEEFRGSVSWIRKSERYYCEKCAEKEGIGG